MLSMRRNSAIICFVLSIVALACRASSAPAPSHAPTPNPATVPSPAAEPAPEWTWADVELLGNHNVGREAILAEVDFEPGAAYETDIEGWRATADRIKAAFDFADVKVSAVRYVGFEAFLTIDVIERGAEHRIGFDPAPEGERALASPEVLALFEQLEELRSQGFERGTPSLESADEGFLDFADPELHAIVLELCAVTPAHRLGLFEVLAHDADKQKRARAATLLNWAGEVADSIARAQQFANDPSGAVRNNLTRFMLHYLDRVESPEVRQELIRQFARQIERPSHTDRNKGTYGLLLLVQAWPDDAPAIEAAAGEALRYIARESILFNVRDPARELLELITGDEPE